jgi:hypothetical protein
MVVILTGCATTDTTVVRSLDYRLRKLEEFMIEVKAAARDQQVSSNPEEYKEYLRLKKKFELWEKEEPTKEEKILLKKLEAKGLLK